MDINSDFIFPYVVIHGVTMNACPRYRKVVGSSPDSGKPWAGVPSNGRENNDVFERSGPSCCSVDFISVIHFYIVTQVR